MKNSHFQFITLLIRIISVTLLGVLILCFFTFYLFRFYEPTIANDKGEINRPRPSANDLAAGDFIIDEGYELVVANCTNCHSSKLVTQNRATAEGWKNTILWMQETQNLWDLGENEDRIVKYLAKNYAPTEQGRRMNLKEIEWYSLEPSK